MTTQPPAAQHCEVAPTPSQRTAHSLRTLLHQHRRTTADMAAALDISQRTASRWINGHYKFSLDDIQAIAAWLQTPVDKLLHLDPAEDQPCPR